MRYANKFHISSKWKLLLLDMGIDPSLVLSHAKLPQDLFNRTDNQLLPNQYFQLWHGIDQAAGEKEAPLLFAKYISAESFDAPIFASLCSPDFNTALKRLQQYKPLIGPMLLDLEQNEEYTRINLSCYGNEGQLPYSLSLAEAVFFTQIIRIATRETIQPIEVCLQSSPRQVAPYEAFFGCPLKISDKLSLTFSASDAQKPFMTSSGAMWEFFEDKLNRKLADATATTETSERVRAVLMEALPSGATSIEQVASKLAMSKRTLQRKLTAEAESFQSILVSVRSELAEHYLKKSDITLGEISFLLGFKEPNSFIRAFSDWNGVSPGQYREHHGLS